MKQGGNGIGSSWANATGDLQYALAKARPGTEIWIAAGTYYPVQCTSCTENDRSVSFVIPEGVTLLGGFRGNEKRAKQRRWLKHLTRLSGNIGRPGPTDNSYTVVLTRGVSYATVLDGLIIADGYADAPKPVGHPFRSGGGLYNDGSGVGVQSNPTLRNCLFLNNFAMEGGALFNNGDLGNASPEIEDCTFTSNRAFYGGGAIFNNGEQGKANPVINYTQFVNNEASFGPGIFHACPEKNTDPKIFNSTFANNKAHYGGCIFLLGMTQCPKMRTVTFVNNISDDEKAENISVCMPTTNPCGLMAEIPLEDEEQ
ncbi:MAG TPA: hypothetical protein ENJ20_01455 [Bacteroidetes bacterium]|nr:hypothetical protein [Bacteroidota bacterium]